MKKVFLAAAVAVFAGLQAQSGFKLGANVGFPVGDAGDTTSFVAGIDAAYLWPASAEFNIGIATGAQFWFGKEYTVPGFGTFKADTSTMIPIAASGQYRLTPEFSLGADLGYAFFTESGSDGGFYYAPKAAYHFGPSELNLSYRGVSVTGGSIGSVNLGYAYSFGK